MFNKKYVAQAVQQDILSGQKRQKLRGNKPLKKDREKNTIKVLPMPIVLHTENTGYEDIGQHIFQDCTMRYRRMQGKQVQYRPYFTYQHIRNTYQWQQAISKSKQQRSRQLVLSGIGFNEADCLSLSQPATTRKVRNTISQLIAEGSIQQEFTINYRDNQTQTSIPSEEIIRKNITETAYNIRYFVDTKNITLIINTSNPTTLFGDVALAVHPDDRRYKKLIGHKAIIPIINRVIPII